MESIDAQSGSCVLAKTYIQRLKGVLGSTTNWHPASVLHKFHFKRYYSMWPAKQKQLIGEKSFKESLMKGSYGLDPKKRNNYSLFRRALGRFSKTNPFLS